MFGRLDFGVYTEHFILFLLEIICFTNFKLFLLASSVFACIGMIMVLYVCMHVVPLILLLEMSIWIYFLVQFCLLFWCGLILEKNNKINKYRYQ